MTGAVRVEVEHTLEEAGAKSEAEVPFKVISPPRKLSVVDSVSLEELSQSTPKKSSGFGGFGSSTASSSAGVGNAKSSKKKKKGKQR